MEEINYNEFLRLKNGKIVRYGEKQNTRVENNRYIDYSGEYEWETCIVKHSPNIIDLIEVGDYVNGLYIHGIYDNGLEVYRYGDCHDILYADEIKSIVTKEQFVNAEYRLED